MAYDEVFRALAQGRVRYLVAGGLAVNLHGVPRMTIDLDLLVDLAARNLGKAVTALASLGFAPRVPVPFADLVDTEKRAAWIREKGMMVFTVFHPERPWELVDILVDPPIEFARAWRCRKRVSVSGLTVPLVGIQDLIAMKRKAGRTQDRSDIDALERIARGAGRGRS